MPTESFRFKFSGGALAPDFVNTLDWRRGDTIECLTDARAIIDWAVQADIVSQAAAKRLRNAMARDKAAAARYHAEALDLRELLFSMFRRRAKGDLPGAQQLRVLNDWTQQAWSHRRIARSGGKLVWSWDKTAATPQTILWQVVESATTILLSDELSNRLRLCDGPGCAWVFLDFSRQQNRRWCSMTVCGNRAKARRHYARQHGTRGA